MPTVLRLPRADGSIERYTLRNSAAWSKPTSPIRSRIAYAAAHVVCDPFADVDPLGAAPIDWKLP